MTNDHEFVRRGLFPPCSIAVAITWTVNRKTSLAFEVSDIDAPGVKTSHLGLVLAGEESLSKGSPQEETAYDFYDAKGLLEGILAIAESWERTVIRSNRGA
jgi:phenylalanyl-tRNA synthetase beta subunit